MYFPTAYQRQLEGLPHLDALRRDIGTAGFTFEGSEPMFVCTSPTLAAYRTRLSYRAISAMAELDADELRQGFAQLDEDIAAGKAEHPIYSPIHLVVFTRADASP
jgi:hypothetical protein